MTKATEQETNVLLCAEDLGEELGLDCVQAQRLIAKRLLPSAQIGQDGGFRVTRAALESYVSKGAPDARIPGEYQSGGAWFDHSLTTRSDAFDTAMRGAMQRQEPSEQALRAKFEANKFSKSLQFQVARIGAVADLLRAPVPQSAFVPSGEQVGTWFATWEDLFAVDVLRRMMKQEISALNRVEPPFSSLYKSPKQFEALVDAAYQNAAGRRIVYSKIFRWTGGIFGPGIADRTAQFLFPLSHVFTPADKTRLVNLAF